MVEQRVQRQLTAILAGDVVGYSRQLPAEVLLTTSAREIGFTNGTRTIIRALRGRL